ncbi:hypothetical protein NEFER03_1489 [Nematocida sp. LUAm3]|nr:hypothetical protein NEFER03_1489 [Nematocida sp. LUAm3]KAI5174522.1 hypothetical protein NEFER02_0643 [Nematocida sp. LUAm2]KAI5178072.1 hypothetical protein NEFER01_1254 [Nematocida sp. LUAm1]
MKESIVCNAYKQNTSFLFGIKISKCKFNLKTLYFFKSEVGFIQEMLTRYVYAPGATIHIDCGGIAKKDVEKLCQDIIDCGFSIIILRNASNIIRKIREKGYAIQHNVKNRLYLRVENRQWVMENIDIVKYLFKKNIDVFLDYLHKAIQEKDQKIVLKRIEEEKKIHWFLVDKTIEETCSMLKSDFQEKIRFVKLLDILMDDKNENHYTTADELLMFVMVLKRIFVNIETICISNLRIKENEIQSLNILSMHAVDTKSFYRLKHIFLKGYTTSSDQTMELSIKKKEAMNYAMGRKTYLSYLLEIKLRERNVLVDYRALPFIENEHNESASNSNQNFWGNNLVNDSNCVKPPYGSENKYIYILHICRHWMYLECAIDISKNTNRCPKCNFFAGFNKSFYILRPIARSVEKNLTEDDFEFFKYPYLELFSISIKQ